jgi:hypothetical protein
VVFLSSGVYLERKGRRISQRVDTAFQVFGLTLMGGVILNIAIELLR